MPRQFLRYKPRFPEDSGEAVKICVCKKNDSYRVALLTTRNEVLYKSVNSDEVSLVFVVLKTVC